MQRSSEKVVFFFSVECLLPCGGWDRVQNNDDERQMNGRMVAGCRIQ